MEIEELQDKIKVLDAQISVEDDPIKKQKLLKRKLGYQFRIEIEKIKGKVEALKNH